MIIEELDGRIFLCDKTSHYFGGFYHVKILVYSDFPVSELHFDSNIDFMEARDILGKSVRFELVLDKMAVPENEISVVRNQLIKMFKETTLVYITAPDFARHFVLATYMKQGNIKTPKRLYGT